ncbi:MAG TPA: hypothetical protein VFH19_05985 [Nitrososphaeraceae archaeon]|nr:hypothetical protein [Nitrososphaeraceae archaeon]
MVADEANILEAFADNRVCSFDHFAINNKVKACDMNQFVFHSWEGIGNNIL